MKATTAGQIEELKERVARRLSDNAISSGPSGAGTVTIGLKRGVARTFKAHWTGYKLIYPDVTMVLRAELADGSFWTEGYISVTQASYVLNFRKDPAKARGTGGPRPDDKFANPQAVERSYEVSSGHLAEGYAQHEEIIRYEDFDDPEEAIDQFFNYTSFYILKAVGLGWSDFNFVAEPSVGWDPNEQSLATLPLDAAIEEGLKRSDIIWVSVDSDPKGKAVPCWFVFTKDKRLFVLSGEPQQTLPNAAQARSAHVVMRWKGRDAALASFDSSVRAITAQNAEEFEEIGHLLINKRQSVRGSAAKNIDKWMSQGVILELTPRG